MLGDMIKTQLESTSSDLAEDPLSYTAEIVKDLQHASTTVTVVVPEELEVEAFPELLGGAAESTRILGLEELHIIAHAQHLPALAVVASNIAHQLPEKFQFCEAESCTHVHPDDDTYLTADSLIQLGKQLGKKLSA